MFVLPDQLGAAWIGCYDNRDVETPTIDRFASTGVLFRRAYTVSPICTPYRGALLTGRYPSQTGVTRNGDPLPQSEVTIAQLLDRGGYATSYVGKWHLSGERGKKTDTGWVPPHARGGFQDFIGWESGHVDHWHGRIWDDDPHDPMAMVGHETDALTDIACERLERLHQRQQPFCLFVAYQAPHPPCSPPEEYAAIYRNKPLSARPNVPPGTRFSGAHYQDHSVIDQQEFLERYLGEVTHLDNAFGRLLSKIDQLGLHENTIVIITSDHGELAGSHGLFEKYVMYEESIHVPLIVRLPGGMVGETDALFSTVDFMPTILDLCGLPPHERSAGMSYGALIRDGEAAQDEVRTEVLIEFKHLCLRRDRYKLITDLKANERFAFYDTVVDPYELNNLLMGQKAGDYEPLAEKYRADLRTLLGALLESEKR